MSHYMFVVAFDSTDVKALQTLRDSLPASGKSFAKNYIGDFNGDYIETYKKVVKLQETLNAVPRKKATQSIFNFSEPSKS